MGLRVYTFTATFEKDECGIDTLAYLACEQKLCEISLPLSLSIPLSICGSEVGLRSAIFGLAISATTTSAEGSFPHRASLVHQRHS